MSQKPAVTTFNFGENDADMLPLKRCVCGATWVEWNGPILTLGDYTEMPCCGRRLRFALSIAIEEERTATETEER